MTYLAMKIFSSIYDYSTVDTRNEVFFIGGISSSGSGGSADVVAKFKADQWSRLPNLQQKRHNHGSIRIGREIINVGGLYANDA